MDWSTVKWLAYDVETANPAPSDRNESFALGITCIAECSYPGASVKVWTPEFDVRKGRYDLVFTPEQVRAFCEHLVHMNSLGYTIVTINGLSFDFRVLAEEAGDLVTYDNMRELSLNHFDPTFQMLCERGFPVGMQAMSDGFALPGKMGGMDGLKAVRMWIEGTRVEQERVLRYVEQDAVATYDIAKKIAETEQIRWITRKGSLSKHSLVPGLVHECLRESVPDTSWWTGDDKPTREEFAKWVLTEELVEEEGFKL